MSYKVKVYKTSLIGPESVNSERVNIAIRKYDDVVKALQDLHQTIMEKSGNKRMVDDDGYRFVIVMPNGRELSMVDAYEKIFGEKHLPRVRTKSMFPRLYKKVLAA